MARILEVKDVWAIAFEDGNLVPPLDDDKSDSFIGYPTEHDAKLGLHAQYAKGYIEGKAKVVQLFVGLPPDCTIQQMAKLLEEWNKSQTPTTRMLISRVELEDLWTKTAALLRRYKGEQP